jgi:hypothetical protein
VTGLGILLEAAYNLPAVRAALALGPVFS